MQNIYYPIYIVYLLLIISLIFFDRKKPVQRFSWILVLVLVPIVGLLLYLFIGSDSFLKYRKRKILKKHGDTLSTLKNIVNHKNKCNNIDANSASKINTFLQEHCGSVLTANNSVEIFTNGSAKYDQLFKELKEAKDNIHVQYFSINNDEIGQELINILIEKVQAGVEVKLLYDSVGCLISLAYPLLRRLKKSGCKVSNIRPHALDINYRNHRKIVIIDGKTGYTGGMNIGANYKYGVKNKPWRDTHLRITGSAVHCLQQIFLSDWVTATKGTGIGLRNEISHYFPDPESEGILSTQIVANGLYNNCKNDDIINLSYFYLISRARRRVWIQTPYFVPSEIILQTLKALASIGVDVRIMTSSSFASASLFHSSITNYFLGYLVNSGVKVFKYDGIIHAKTMLIDDDALCIGTVNLNARSLERDDELYAYFESPEFLAEYEAIFNNDLKHCKEMDYIKFQNQPLATRAVESAMSFFSSLT
jgi:cardiolipin synthase A/B